MKDKNDKLCDRNFSNVYNDDSHFQRMEIERDFNIKLEEKSDNNSDGSQHSSNIGEITGEKIKKKMIIDKGMPMRSRHTLKKPLYDQNINFDLHEKVNTKTNIQYDDNNQTSPFAELGEVEETLTSQLNPMNVLSNSIEKFGTILYNNFIINTIGLYSLFVSLYMASDHITEIEMGKFFNFPKKEILYQTLSNTIAIINNSPDVFRMKNLIVLGNNIPCIREFYETIKQFCMFVRVNIQNPITESKKLNYVVNKILRGKIRNPTVPANIMNLQMMFMSISIVRPIWTYAFDKIIKDDFNGHNEYRKILYLVSVRKSYNYFEDTNHQLIEIKCGKGQIVFGVLLHKNMLSAETNKNLHFYISHIKPTILDEVRIPKFTQDVKLRYNSILKNLGLNSVFVQITAKDFFPEKIQLHDVIQNIKVIIGGETLGLSNNMKGQRSMKTFVANKPFAYYFRITETNTIIMNGLFQ